MNRGRDQQWVRSMASGISDQTSPDSTKLGAWLFRHRTAIPIPIALALLIVPAGRPFSWTCCLAGVAITVGGEALRVAAVHQIGVISRTRSDRLGPLVTSGPFAFVRNPLYIGNVLIWMGFAVTAGLLWAAPIAGLLLVAEYHAIAKWEEERLESRFGHEYATYRSAVPRWLPRLSAWHRVTPVSRQEVAQFSWRETLFSERGTLVAIAAGYALLWLKARF